MLAALERRQAREGGSLGRLASELLAKALAQADAEPRPLQWASQPMHALVDLEDREALSGVLDRDAPS